MLNNVPKTQTEQHPQLHNNIPTSSIFIYITIHLVCYYSVLFCRCTHFKIQNFSPLCGKFIFEIWGWWSYYFVFSMLGNSIIPPLVSIFEFVPLVHQFYQYRYEFGCWFFYRSHDFYHYELMMVIVKAVSSGVVWGGCLGWLGGMDDNTTPILSPSPFLVVYK